MATPKPNRPPTVSLTDPLPTWEEIYALVPPEWQEEFRRFVRTGEASEEFFRQLEANPNIEKASDLSLDLRLGRLARLAHRDEPEAKPAAPPDPPAAPKASPPSRRPAVVAPLPKSYQQKLAKLCADIKDKIGVFIPPGTVPEAVLRKATEMAAASATSKLISLLIQPKGQEQSGVTCAALIKPITEQITQLTGKLSRKTIQWLQQHRVDQSVPVTEGQALPTGRVYLVTAVHRLTKPIPSSRLHSAEPARSAGAKENWEIVDLPDELEGWYDEETRRWEEEAKELPEDIRALAV